MHGAWPHVRRQSLELLMSGTTGAQHMPTGSCPRHYDTLSICCGFKGAALHCLVEVYYRCLPPLTAAPTWFPMDEPPPAPPRPRVMVPRDTSKKTYGLSSWSS